MRLPCDSLLILHPISSFTLMTDRENQNGVLTFLYAIERHVTAMPTRDNQFAQFMLYGPTDQRMTH